MFSTQRLARTVPYHAVALVLAAVATQASAQSPGDAVHAAGVTQSAQLDAAIAEVRSGPFHSGVGSVDLWAGNLQPMALISTFGTASGWRRNQETPPDTLASSGRLFAATAGVGLLAYPVGAFVFFYSRELGTPTSSEIPYLALGMAIPVAAVGMAARVQGADPGRAALGSILGGALGLAAFSVVDHPVIGLGLANVAHAAVTTIAARIHFRRRPRS